MLSEAEIEALDNFLLYRTDEEDDDPDRDEGIIGISELDGFLTAIVVGRFSFPPRNGCRWFGGNLSRCGRVSKNFNIF